MSPLDPIATEAIRLSESCGRTPVIVTPRYLSLRSKFVEQFALALIEQTDREIRIDWCRPLPTAWTLVSDRIARIHAAMINRRLRTIAQGRSANVSLQMSISIGRPGGAQRELIVGLCDERFPLPPWTNSILLSAASVTASKTDRNRSNAAA